MEGRTDGGTDGRIDPNIENTWTHLKNDKEKYKLKENEQEKGKEKEKRKNRVVLFFPHRVGNRDIIRWL